MNLIELNKHKKIFIYAKAFSLFGLFLVIFTIFLSIARNYNIPLSSKLVNSLNKSKEKDFLNDLLNSANLSSIRTIKQEQKTIVLKTNDSKNNIKLKGISTFNEYKTAIFEITDSKKQFLLKEGDFIENYKILNIFKDYVLLSELIKKDKPQKSRNINHIYTQIIDNIEKVSDNYFKIKKNILLENLKDPQKFLSASRIIPQKIEGNATGFLIKNVKKGSFFNSLGLQDGDIILKINGESFNNTFTVLNQLTKIKDKKAIYLEILRNKKLFAIKYELK